MNIDQIKEWKKEESDYFASGVLVHVKNGNGHLFWEPLSDQPALGSYIYYYGNCELGNLN